MDVTLYDKNGESINMDNLVKDALIEERKINSAIRNLSSNHGNVSEDEAPEEEESSLDDALQAAAEEGLTTTSDLSHNE